MSLFPHVPDRFPMRHDLTTRPLSYRLQQSAVDRFVTIALAVMWIVLGPLFICLGTGVFDSDPKEIVFDGRLVSLLVIAYLVWAVFFYFGPQILAALRVVDVTIDEGEVRVVDRKLWRHEDWRAPLSSFAGVALQSIGTHDVNGTKVPILSLMLVHEDLARSVPLAIDREKQIGRKTVQKAAVALDVPALDGVVDPSSSEAYSADVLVANRYQAMKVRILYYAVLVLGTAGALAAAYYGFGQGWTGETLAGFVCAVTLIAAMQAYAYCYVIDMRQRGESMEVTTASLLAPRETIDRAGFGTAKYNDGKLWTVRHSVNAPWLTLWIEGRRLPLIVDMQADYVAEKKLAMLGSQ